MVSVNAVGFVRGYESSKYSTSLRNNDNLSKL